jgi:hypothetical protein
MPPRLARFKSPLATTRDPTALRRVLHRVMQVGLNADAEIRNSDKYPVVNRLSDVPGAGGLESCCERRRADRDMLVGLL